MKRLFAGTLTAMLALSLTACGQQEQGDAKPVIYLYSEQETTVSVSLDYAGTLTATYPAYENGWTVTAEPDGTLYDENGNEYSYLFWEGENNTDYDFSKGFCVAGADTADFLHEKLAEIGLTPREMCIRDRVSVSLDYAGTLTATYPAYENGWTVTAEPDGTLYDENGNESVSYTHLSHHMTISTPSTSAIRSFMFLASYSVTSSSMTRPMPG